MSVYAKFLDKNKSKLCESKSKKVSLKKLKRVNENQVESDETVLEKVYTNQNVKETLRIDKCYMDDGTIEYVVNCNILGVEEWFTDFSKAKEYYYEIMDEFKREVDNYYDDDDDDDTIDESAKQRKIKKPFLRKSLKESAKDRFLKKVFSKSKLSESRILKRTRKVKVPMNEATVNYLLRFTADGIKAGCLIGTKKDIDSIKRIYKNKSFKEIETYRLKSSDEETMYYQMEKLANSVKGKKGVDIRKTNDGKIGAIYFTDEYKGNEYKKILD